MSDDSADGVRHVIEASVIVPTRNRHELLVQTVRSLDRQTFPRERYEIIVVDDGSDPRVEVGDGVRLLRHPEPRGPNAARNTGAAAARGELLCYVDDDIEATPNWLASVAQGASRHSGLTVFTGRVKVRLEGAGPPYCDRIPLVAQGESELDFGADEGPAQYACGANLTIPRSALDRVGTFREDHPIYFDESEWVDRLRNLGGDVVYLPDAMVWHRRVGRDLALWPRLRRSFRLGYGEAYTRWVGGRPYGGWELARRVAGVPALLLHSWRHRCTFGVGASASELGRVWWLLSGRRERLAEAADRQ